MHDRVHSLHNVRLVDLVGPPEYRQFSYCRMFVPLYPLQKDLVSLFVQVDYSCPSEVSLAALLANKTANDLIQHATGYILSVSYSPHCYRL
jgi:hypothetical protein